MDFWRRSARISRKDKIRNTIIKQNMNVARSLLDDIGVVSVLQHRYHSNPTTPKLQHTSNQEQHDQCGKSTE